MGKEMKISQIDQSKSRHTLPKSPVQQFQSRIAKCCPWSKNCQTLAGDMDVNAYPIPIWHKIKWMYCCFTWFISKQMYNLMHSNDQNNFRFMEFNVTLIQQHFRYIVVIRFIGRGNRRQPLTCHRSDKFYQCCFEYITPWTRFELTN